MYLYHFARTIKQAGPDELAALRLNAPDNTVYSIFMENSTRTKESFRNAALFHGAKVNTFDAETSSFQKRETITDTFKMLAGYTLGPTVFVVRTKLEGVCRWLEDAIGPFCERNELPPCAFVNAGDGRHEHPTQEYLDEFSFLEVLDWDRSEIHVALIGDLYHGRTVHSKADGLKVFKKVRVDLIAPPELQMPALYQTVMRSNGFEVRVFSSLDDYLAQESVARLWYFTRLQLERMGDLLAQKADHLREAVTVREEMLPKLPPAAKFFHPLPRDSHHPTIPFWLDNLEHNMWDRQSRNGYFVRTALISLLMGGEAPGPLPTPPLRELPDVDFVEELERTHKRSAAFGGPGILPLTDGVVIDHISGKDTHMIWGQLQKVWTRMGFDSVGAMGVYPSKMTGMPKGIISLPNYALEFDRKQLKKLAALSPGCTVNFITENTVQRKFRLHMPPRIYNFPNLQCKNSACISNPINMQREVGPHFIRPTWQSTEAIESVFICRYCETAHDFVEIWTA